MRIVAQPRQRYPWESGIQTGVTLASTTYTTCEHCSLFLDGVPLAQHPSVTGSKEPFP